MVLGGIGLIVGLYYYNQMTGSSNMAVIATQCWRSYDSSLSRLSELYTTPENPRFFLEIQQLLFSSGIEHQPGPTCLRNFTLIVGNITCLNTHLQQVSNIKADAMVFQEHSCLPGEWAAMHKHMRNKRKRLILGQLDPEVKHNLGGLGIVSTHTRQALKVKPITQSFSHAVATGRTDHYAVDIGGTSSISIYNLYGWTWGSPEC